MRRAAKVDANHTAIVDALRAIGAQVESLAPLGRGCPDLLVSYAGRWFVLEVKQPTGRLRPQQVVWINRHAADVRVVRSAADAVAYVQGGE